MTELTSWLGLWKLVDTRSMMKSDMDGSASGIQGYLHQQGCIMPFFTPYAAGYCKSD